MKPFFTLCMILTVIQVLSVINGVLSVDRPLKRTASKDTTKPQDATTPADDSLKKTTTTTTTQDATTPADDSSKKTTTTTTTSKTNTQRQQSTKRKTADGEQTTPGNRRPAADQQQQQQVADDADADDDNEGPPPTGVLGAGRRLVKTARQESNRQAASMVNGGTGLLRMGSGLMALLGGTVRRQTDNVRQVTREGFGMANGLGDSAARGAVRVMRNKADVGRDVAGRMGDVADATAASAKKFSRLGGAAVVTPISLAGDVADLGTAAVTIPKNASKKVTGFVAQTVLPRLGADKMTPVDGKGDKRATAAAATDQVEEVQEDEEMVDVDES